MAEETEDFSSLPLTDRFVHKVWKVRKQAYEEVAQLFATTSSESDPAFRPFLYDSGLWKSAVVDSNVAAQQEGIAALCALLKYGGKEACARTRSQTVSSLVEKGLSSSRAATKASSLEALLLMVELDSPMPVIEDMLSVLTNKQPKVVAACLAALTSLYHNYGCRILDPKPVLKVLPKAFGHADKNVRTETTNLAVEFYRWLREAMKPMFWSDLKPMQQTDLETQFERVKAEAAPKQERLLRSQQDALAHAAPVAPGLADDQEDLGADADEASQVDTFDLAEPQDVMKRVPADLQTSLASAKWKDRKEALEALYTALDVPRIKDADFSEISRGLAKCMKDANVAVVTQAAQCVEVLAKGLRSPFSRYRATVMTPILERLKEKKQTVSDALGAALDQAFLATSLSDCLEEAIAFLTNKNPQVKEGTMRFLVRCLRTTRQVPSKSEIVMIVESAKKLLSESSEVIRSGGAEMLGTIMKIIGERSMASHLDGLDDIRKTKIREFYETAEVRAKERPRAIIGPPGPLPRGGVKKSPPASSIVSKKPVTTPGTAGAVSKRTNATAAPLVASPSDLAPQPTSRAAPASKLAMARPSGGATGLKATQKRSLPVSGTASPRKPLHAASGPALSAPSPAFENEAAIPMTSARLAAPTRGGLTARSLTKPTATMVLPETISILTPVTSGLAAVERAELEELRAANDRLTRLVEEMRQERTKLLSETQELKNQNAGLIEDHTYHLLTIKSKETQLVRARSDAEANEQVNERLSRELERLKRALSRAEGLGSGGGGISVPGGIGSNSHDEAGIYHDGGPARDTATASRHRVSFASTLSEEKENGETVYPRSKLSPEARSGRGSPTRIVRTVVPPHRDEAGRASQPVVVADKALTAAPSGLAAVVGRPVVATRSEDWTRAAEVTSALRARIELLKAKQQRP